MLAATHMLGGAAAYKLTGRRKWIGLSFAFASHFFLDRIPHNELGISGNLAVGSPVILFCLYLGWKQRDGFFPVAAFLGALPDLLSIFHVSGTFHRFHRYLHFNADSPLPWYLWILEFLVAVGLFFYILKNNKENNSGGNSIIKNKI